MSIINSNQGRVSSAMTADSMLSILRQTQTEMMKIQQQISSGKKVSVPSDNSGAASAIGNFRNLLAQFDQHTESLSNASDVLAVTDSTLSDISDLVTQAQSIASSQIGVTSDATTRSSQAEIVDSLIDSLSQSANADHNGIFLFSGRTSSTKPFTELLGGYRYTGSRENLAATIGQNLPIDVNSNGASALGALSSRVVSTVDLDPAATATTRLSDVAGARNVGVQLGTVNVTIDGTQVSVDLTHSDSLGDIATRINSAINGIDPTAGGLAVSSKGFTLTAAAGHTIDIAEVGAGVTAADLGIGLTATGAAVVGGDVNPKLTLTTDVSTFGVPVDMTSGLSVTSGSVTKVIDFTGATTIQDMANKVSAADMGLRLEINSSGTGLNLVNEVSGIDVSIGENAGGTTASDLGVRSLTGSTQLADFNHGLGVRILGSGQNDIEIQLHDGTKVDVSLTGATTVADVMSAINTAGGGSVTAGMAASGNGLELTDTTAGAGAFTVIDLNNGYAAEDLGIKNNVGAGATITGTDVAKVRNESVFTHLMALRDALRQNDTRGITLAGEALNRDLDTLTRSRASTGVRSNRIDAEKTRTADRKIQTASLLSGLQDTDVTSAITRFTQLQQQLQANLQMGAQVMKLTLLDFLK